MAWKQTFAAVPGGVQDRANPLSYYWYGWPYGTIWYVHSPTGSNTTSGYGRAPEAPFASIAMAVSQAEADNDDVVVCLPGHVESVSAAGGLNLNVAGLRVVGVGRGAKQPKLDFVTSAAATVTLAAARVDLENFQVEASYADVASQLVVTGTDCRIAACRFLEPTVNENALVNVLAGGANTADGLVVEGCEFRGVDAANTIGVSIPNAQDRVRIERNLFLGKFATAAVYAAAAQSYVCVRDNDVYNASATGRGIDLAAGTTGIFR